MYSQIYIESISKFQSNSVFLNKKGEKVTFFQSEIYNILIKNYLRPSIGDRILDIGCGPADLLSYLPQVEYIGFDANSKYISDAKRRYGNQGTFICQLVTSNNLTYKEY